MADNYLEKRMDALRSGRLAVKKAIPGIRPKARRVLVAGGCHGMAREKVLEFRKAGYWVAVFDSDGQAGLKMAYEHGIRFHRVEIEDERAVSNEILSLLSVWRGVDTLVGTNEIIGILNKIIRIWKENLPMPDKSDIDIVIISEIPQS